MQKLCGRCKSRPRKAHANSKWCPKCAKELVHRPRGTLTALQRAFAARHAGDMTVVELARRFKTSAANVKRSCRGILFFSHNGKYKNRPELVRQVLDYYFEHGNSATVSAFPHINVKSIVDRPEYYGVKRQYRRIRWTGNQLIECAKMAGIVSLSAQAKFFNRPGANEGAMKSVWVKRFKNSGGSIHGMSEFAARHLVKRGTPYLATAYWRTRRDNKEFGRKLFLWVDMERRLRPEIPSFIRDAISQMAEFQRWLFQNKNPRHEIVRMMKAREM